MVDAIIIPNVQPKYSDLPAKGVYRFRRFDGILDHIISGSRFALMLNTPSAWDVDGASDTADMDNLTFPTDAVRVVMRGLVLEAVVRSSGRGLQGIPLELRLNDRLIDRSVSMAFPGYTQLHGEPGLYTLQVTSNEYLQLLAPTTVPLASLAFNTAIANVKVVMGDESILGRQSLSTLYWIYSPNSLDLILPKMRRSMCLPLCRGPSMSDLC